MFKGDSRQFLAAVRWATRSICGERVPEGVAILLRLVDGRVLVEASYRGLTASTRLSAELVGGGLRLAAGDVVGWLGGHAGSGEDFVIERGQAGLSLRVGTATRVARRRPALSAGAGWLKPLVRVEGSDLTRAVRQARTLSGGKPVFIEVGCERVVVAGVEGGRAIAIPMEADPVGRDLRAVERFSVPGLTLETAARGLEGMVTLGGVWLPVSGGGSARDDDAPEGRACFDRLQVSDGDSTAVLRSLVGSFRDYRALLQSGPGDAVELDPAELRVAVSHAGAVVRAYGAHGAVVELRARDDRVLVVPVIRWMAKELDARSVDAVLHGDLPARVRYPADDLATALVTFTTRSVTIFVDGSDGRATIVEAPGRWDDEDLARRSVAAFGLPESTP